LGNEAQTKGTYVNRVGDKYYLYAAHSERIPGTKKVQRGSDGYIGRITEQDGLIPAKDKVQYEPVVFECGLCMTMLVLCRDVHTGLRREFRAAADWILVAGLLTSAYGNHRPETYRWSYLSARFPGLNMDKTVTDKQSFGVQRCARMADELMHRQFGDDAPIIMERLSRVYQVCVNGKFYLSASGSDAKRWLAQHGIDWGDLLGEN
jgi:hypothetical protein